MGQFWQISHQGQSYNLENWSKNRATAIIETQEKKRFFRKTTLHKEL